MLVVVAANWPNAGRLATNVSNHKSRNDLSFLMACPSNMVPAKVQISWGEVGCEASGGIGAGCRRRGPLIRGSERLSASRSGYTSHSIPINHLAQKIVKAVCRCVTCLRPRPCCRANIQRNFLLSRQYVVQRYSVLPIFLLMNCFSGGP